jgi:hypothetical protein
MKQFQDEPLLGRVSGDRVVIFVPVDDELDSGPHRLVGRALDVIVVVRRLLDASQVTCNLIWWKYIDVEISNLNVCIIDQNYIRNILI